MAQYNAACEPVDDMPAPATAPARPGGQPAWIDLCAPLLAAAMVFFAACGPAKPAGTPLPAGVLFQDDFSNSNSGWDKHTGADVTTDYDNGQYLIAISDPGVDVWGQPGLDLTD